MSLIKSYRYLTHTREVAMILSRFLRDVDALKHLLAIYSYCEKVWNHEFYRTIYQRHLDHPSILRTQRRHSMLFDVRHFYPKFLSELSVATQCYEPMNIRDKVKLLEVLNEDEDTIHMRRKSIYLFQRNRVDESRVYPMETLIHPNSAKFLVGVISYIG